MRGPIGCVRGVHVEQARAVFHVAEHGHASGMQDSERRGDVRVRRNEDLVTVSDAGGTESRS